MKIVDDRIRTLADTYLQVRSPTPCHFASDCRCRTIPKLCNLCEEHVNAINTVPDPNPNLRVGGQLPNPNECNSILTSENRGETLTPNSNECHSTLMSVIRGIYPHSYIYAQIPSESSMIFQQHLLTVACLQHKKSSSTISLIH